MLHSHSAGARRSVSTRITASALLEDKSLRISSSVSSACRSGLAGRRLLRLFQDFAQVVAVVAFARLIREFLELVRIDEFFGVGDLLDATDFQALPLFQRLHEL